MRFWMVVFLLSLVAFVFFAGWTIQTIWLASFFSKTPESFDSRMGLLLVATALCFVSMVTSIAIYMACRAKVAHRP